MSKYKVKSRQKKVKTRKIFSILKFFLFVATASFLVFVYFDLKFDIDIASKRSENFQEVAHKLIKENSQLRQFAFEVCKDSNVLGQYLMMEGRDCSRFFPDFLKSAEEEELDKNIQSDFILIVDVFILNKDLNQHLINKIVEAESENNIERYDLIESPKASIVALNEEQSESSADLEDENQDNTKENTENQEDDLQKILNDENIVNYLADYSIIFERNEENEKLIQLKNNEIILADIYLDDFEQKLKINLLQEQLILSVEDFSKTLKTAQHKLAEENNFNIAAFLENIKKLEEDKSERDNILLLGKSGSNVDTIILVSIDHTRKKITLISIPRDLWIDSKKINSFFAFFGIEIFKGKIVEIAGQKISHYIMVDMMIFPVIVNELGGIEYEFTEPLIDPTYRTVDNGVEGTLYFKKGIAHLNGIQALRVARSRYTTSDFHRAERQQKLLKSIQAKINELGKTKAIAKLIAPIITHVETDYDFYEILPLILKSKDYELRSGAVISTKNILISKMLDTGGEKRAYILEPKNNDWSLIKKFVLNEILKD